MLRNKEPEEVLPSGKSPEPMKEPILLPEKAPHEHLTPMESKHQDFLHEHHGKLVGKINSGTATPEDHKTFSKVREKLNQLSTLAQTRAMALAQQSGQKIPEPYISPSGSWATVAGPKGISHSYIKGDRFTTGINEIKGKKVADVKDHQIVAYHDTHPVTGAKGPMQAGDLPYSASVSHEDIAKAIAETKPSLLRKVLGYSELGKIGMSLTDAGSAHGKVRKLLQQKAVPAGEVQGHGMAKPEDMEGVKYGHTDLVWGKGNNASQRTAAATIHDMHVHDIPKALTRYTNRIVFSDQVNKHDGALAKMMGVRSFSAAATAGSGDGDVVLHKSANTRLVRVFPKGILAGLIAHEMGHNLAQSEWGKVSPDEKSAYGKAQKQEPPINSYAKVGPEEDFAVAVDRYVTDKEKFKKAFPLKYAALHEIIERHSK